MNFFNLFFPQSIHLPDSRYNKNISVTRYFQSNTLLVDGLIESGDIMTQIWRKGLNTFLPRNFHPRKVLLLGLAGGCNAKLINRCYPQAKITAVEIDPAMVDIGNRYFDLQKINNLHIVVADALDFINHLKSSDSFDLVLVDCFVGQSIPKKLENLAFIWKLKDHCRFVLINRLWWSKEKDITLDFFRSLSTRFFFIKTHTRTNVLISLV